MARTYPSDDSRRTEAAALRAARRAAATDIMRDAIPDGTIRRPRYSPDMWDVIDPEVMAALSFDFLQVSGDDDDDDN